MSPAIVKQLITVGRLATFPADDGLELAQIALTAAKFAELWI